MTFLLALCFFFLVLRVGIWRICFVQKARIWEEDDVMTPVTFCSNCMPLLFNASLHIDLERTSSKVVTPLDNGCGLTILAILFFFSLCVSKKVDLFPLFRRRRSGGRLRSARVWVVDKFAFFLCYSRCRAGMGRWAVGE